MSRAKHMPHIFAIQPHHMHWLILLSLFTTQEEHVLHLVQPVWDASFASLWHINHTADAEGRGTSRKPGKMSSATHTAKHGPQKPTQDSTQTNNSPDAAKQNGDALSEAYMPTQQASVMQDALNEAHMLSQRVVWVGVLLRRAVGSSNAGIRCLGLSAFLKGTPVGVLEGLSRVSGLCMCGYCCYVCVLIVNHH